MKWIEVQGELHGGNSGGGGRRRARYGRRLIANCSAKLSFVVTLSEMSLRHCHLVIIYRGPPMIDTFVNCRVDIIHPPSQIMTRVLELLYLLEFPSLKRQIILRSINFIIIAQYLEDLEWVPLATFIYSTLLIFFEIEPPLILPLLLEVVVGCGT